MHRLLAGVVLSCLSSPLVAQQLSHSTPATVEAMKQLEFLVGEWEGDAWITIGPGQRHRAHQKEWVRRAAGGELLVIEGLGIAADSGDMQGQAVHKAFAVVSFDPAENVFRFRAYRAGGTDVFVVAEISERKLVWKMPTGTGQRGGTIVFTMQVTDSGEWYETGDFYAPGATSPVRMMEMRLKKKP